MKLFLHILIGLLLFSACNNRQKTKPSENTSIEDKKPVNENDLFSSLYQHYHQNLATQEEIDQNLIIDYAIENQLDLSRSSSGLYYKILVTGEGENIKWGDQITTHYKGYFLDGKEFDNSYKRGNPITFYVGNMVAPWNEGLQYMKRGGKAIFLTPSKLGYGEDGFPGFVPPNKVLIFELEVLP